MPRGPAVRQFPRCCRRCRGHPCFAAAFSSEAEMALHPLAGRPGPAELLIDVARLEQLYYEGRPDPEDPLQRVSFGTSGHRGTPLETTFTESHILAISQAIAEYRRAQD